MDHFIDILLKFQLLKSNNGQLVWPICGKVNQQWGSRFQEHHPLPPLPPCLTSANRKLTVSDFSLPRRRFAHKMCINTKRSRRECSLSTYFHMTFPGKSPHEGRSNPGRQTVDWRRNADRGRGLCRPFPKTFKGCKTWTLSLFCLSDIAVERLLHPPHFKNSTETPNVCTAAYRALDPMTRITITQPLWVSASHLVCQNLCWVTFTNCVHF